MCIHVDIKYTHIFTHEHIYTKTQTKTHTKKKKNTHTHTKKNKKKNTHTHTYTYTMILYFKALSIRPMAEKSDHMTFGHPFLISIGKGHVFHLHRLYLVVLTDDF